MVPQSLDRGLQLGSPLPLQPADHPGGDGQPEQVEGQLLDRSLAQAVSPGQDAEDGPQPGAEGPGGHARRQDGTGRGPAPWALQAMEPVLIDARLDRRHFGDLVADRFGVIAVEVVPTPATAERLARDDLAELL